MLANLNNTPLWQDEAESALNAMTINSCNFIPKGILKNDMPMHEMTLYFPKQGDPEYDYYPTHYRYTPYVTIHGWIPYYFIKAGIVIFGQNEFGPRFFSAVFFILFLALLYRIVSIYSGYIIAIMTVVYMSLMPNMLTYSMQVRYYAYSLFFFFLAIYYFVKMYESEGQKYLLYFVISEVLLYYTYMTLFILSNIVFAIFILMKNRKIFRSYLSLLVISIIFILPHIFITKFYLLALSLPSKHDFGRETWGFLKTILNWNYLILLFFIIFLIFTICYFIWSAIRKNKKILVNNFDIITILFFLIGYPFISYSTPVVAYYQRILLQLVPFVVYGGIRIAFCVFDLQRNKYVSLIGGFIIFIVLLCNPVNYKSTVYKIKEFISKDFKPFNIPMTDSRWVLNVIRYINSTRRNNPLILASFENFVFTYYSNYDAQLIWPVRKEFIDLTKRDLFIILEDNYLLNQHCEIFYTKDKHYICQDEKKRNYYDCISKCKKTQISSVTVYESLNEI